MRLVNVLFLHKLFDDILPVAFFAGAGIQGNVLQLRRQLAGEVLPFFFLQPLGDCFYGEF